MNNTARTVYLHFRFTKTTPEILSKWPEITLSELWSPKPSASLAVRINPQRLSFKNPAESDKHLSVFQSQYRLKDWSRDSVMRASDVLQIAVIKSTRILLQRRVFSPPIRKRPAAHEGTDDWPITGRGVRGVISGPFYSLNKSHFTRPDTVYSPEGANHTEPISVLLSTMGGSLTLEMKRSQKRWCWSDTGLLLRHTDSLTNCCCVRFTGELFQICKY